MHVFYVLELLNKLLILICEIYFEWFGLFKLFQGYSSLEIVAFGSDSDVGGRYM